MWILAAVGVDFSHTTHATLNALTFLSDAILPFFVLFLVSFFTTPVSKPALDRFYARIHTPVHADSTLDRKELELSYANPGRFRSRLWFPDTNWEMLKPDRTDVLGFLLAVAVAGMIVALVFGVAVKMRGKI